MYTSRLLLLQVVSYAPNFQYAMSPSCTENTSDGPIFKKSGGALTFVLLALLSELAARLHRGFASEFVQVIVRLDLTTHELLLKVRAAVC